jgi:DNA-binding NtrC family response regulator
LLIDDEANVRASLAANLELAGFEVVEAESIAEAAAQLGAGRFDMVVSDVRMPDKDGMTGLEELRKIQPDLPAVFVTGYDPDGVLPTALARGAYTVLPKPLSMDRLVQVIRRALASPVVLVVDDEEGFLDAVVEGLREAGLRVERAVDGVSTLAVLQGNNVDVCILDLVLPVRDGVQVFADLRQHDPEITVIAMTSYDVAGLIRDVMKAGAYQCLHKPLEVQLLAQLIGRARGEVAPLGRKRA